MRITPECVPCLLYRTLYESRLVDEKKSWKVIKAAVDILAELLPEDEAKEEMPVSAEVATIVHKKTYQLLKNKDPYKELKKRSNHVAFSLLGEAERFINKSEDPLSAAALVSIIGNLLDFGIRSSGYTPEKLKAEFNKLAEEGLHHSEISEIRELLRERGEMLYFTDNCGEIVFDKLLIKEIKKLGTKIYLVVKGEPILTDATVEDAILVGLEREVEDIYTTGTYAVGVHFPSLPVEVKKKMDMKIPILAKGMANYESFSELNYRPIIHLLRIKCEPVAKSMGLKKDMNVAVVFK